jgi:hypothetical protein
MIHHESACQIAVVQYIRYRYPKVLFTASTSGVKLPMVTAINLKRLGSQKGVPDLIIFESSRGYHGLMIELKRNKTPWGTKGRCTPEQEDWIKKLNERGYCAQVCYGFSEAKAVLDMYFSGDQKEKVGGTI